MKYKIQNLIAGALLSFLIISGVSAQNLKLAQSGFQFLSVVSDARAAAMADAMTSLEIESSSLFFNPAGMADMTGIFDVSASINQWIADIKHNSLSAAIKPYDGRYGVIGFSLQYVDYGDFYGTRVNLSSPQGYDDIGIFTLNALAVGVGYAKQLTDRFSVGGQVRWVRQDLGQSMIASNSRSVTVHRPGGLPDSTITIADTSYTGNKLNPIIFDFGTQFRTGLKSLVFGMSVRNFSAEYKFAEEGIQAPLVFTLGISMNVLDLAGEMPFEQSLYVSVDASHHRDHPEQVKVGIDYKIFNALSLRGGYTSTSDVDEFSGFSFGIGLSHFGFGFDYSYTPFGIFDKVQRFTARFSLDDIFTK